MHTDPRQNAGKENNRTGCMWCGGALADDGSCTQCGRTQKPVCECGYELQPGQDRCPNCGARWQGLVKVKRRKRAHRTSIARILQYAALGAVAALLIGLVGASILNQLAAASAETPQLPQSVYARVQLAMHTLLVGVQQLCANAMAQLSRATGVVIAGLVGALIGVLYYMYRHRIGVFAARSDQNVHNAGRRRRM